MGIKCDTVVEENEICTESKISNNEIQPMIHNTFHKLEEPTEKDAISSEIASNKHRDNSENSCDFNIEKQPKSSSSSMMAALGQPSSAPPSCGAPPPSVDPRY